MSRYIKKCSLCGKEFSLFFCDYRRYIYKVKRNGKFIYQCSYNCYCKELTNGQDKKYSITR